MKNTGPTGDELAILGQQDDGIFKQLLTSYDAPAFVRRARQTQDAYDDLLRRCGNQRSEWLKGMERRLAALHARSDGWDRLRPLLADEGQVAVLEELWDSFKPAAVKAQPTASARQLRRDLRELCEAIERFNRLWSEFLRDLDLGPINALRDGYNRWYVLEKECAVRSPRVARQGFRPLPPVTLEEIAALFPLLPIPEQAE